MIRGKVHSTEKALTGAPRVTVSVANISDSSGALDVEALVDTVFTAYLTLPSEIISTLGLPPLGTRSARLANDQVEEFEVYAGLILWNGHHQNVPVIRSDSESLLGMALLWGRRITIEAWADGDVIIDDPTS